MLTTARAQGTLEYLLLVGGAVLVGTVIVLLVLSATPQGSVNGALDQYHARVSFDTLFTSPPALDASPPTQLEVTAQGYEGHIVVSFSAQDETPLHYTLLRAASDHRISLIPNGNFEGYFTVVGIQPLLNNSSLTTFDDHTMYGGSDSYYRVQACDSATPRHCVSSDVVSALAYSVSDTATIGSPELVFDSLTDGCDALDLPDVSVRAIRNPLDESEIIFASGDAPRNYMSYGPDFDHLHRDCSHPALESNNNLGAYPFNNQEWLGSLFAENGIVYGLIHNEYHSISGVPPCTTSPGPDNPCWYNVILGTTSTDGGHTFDPLPPLTNPVVAAPPYPWQEPETTEGPNGLFGPSNIIVHDDGEGAHYYSLISAYNLNSPPANSGTCVMRTDNLNDPDSWRAWNGTDFSLSLHAPYNTSTGDPQPTGLPFCTFVSHEKIGTLVGNVSYNTCLHSYLMVGEGVFMHHSIPTCGVFYSRSSNLVDWETPELLMDGQLSYEPCGNGGSENIVLYPSLIDHASPDPNFNTTGQDAYLYYTKINPENGLDRDLMRRPVHFQTCT